MASLTPESPGRPSSLDAVLRDLGAAERRRMEARVLPALDLAQRREAEALPEAGLLASARLMERVARSAKAEFEARPLAAFDAGRLAVPIAERRASGLGEALRRAWAGLETLAGGRRLSPLGAGALAATLLLAVAGTWIWNAPRVVGQLALGDAPQRELLSGQRIATGPASAVVRLASGTRIEVAAASQFEFDARHGLVLHEGEIHIVAALATDPLVVLSEAGRLSGDSGELTLRLSEGEMELRLAEGDWTFLGSQLVREMHAGEHVRHVVGTNELRFERDSLRPRTVAFAGAANLAIGGF